MITICVIMTHFWERNNYLKAFQVTFNERKTNVYFDNVIKNSKNSFRNIKQFWKFFTSIF